MVLRDVDLAAVHVLEDGIHVVVGDVLQHDDGVSGGVVVQEEFEVGRARGEDDL